MTDRTNQLINPADLAAVVRKRPHGNLEPRGYTGIVPPGTTQPQDPGRFGRMFPFLPAHQEDRGDLEQLGNPAPAGSGLMVDDGTVADSPIPSGFTYLGQFIDHDITFDPTSSLDKQNDPKALSNFRTPRLDLDSLYAGGPADAPFLYDRDDPDKFLLGPSNHTGSFDHPSPDAAGDLPRNSQDLALLGDPRNDENLIVAQLHRLFLKFHNRVVDWLRGKHTAAPLVFTTAQQLVRWHYQWIVVNDYLPRIVGKPIVQDILTHGRRFYRFFQRPFMPVEFSVAAFRFGHSMVRDDYRFHRAGPPATSRPFPTASLSLFFRFTRTNTTAVDWILHPDDWENFFETNPGTAPVMARAIDPRLAAILAHLPNLGAGAGPTSLATRNLLRGLVMGLPSGQAVAQHMATRVPGIVPLTAAEIAAFDPSGFLQTSGLAASTPLWFYLLLEAQLREGGVRLGPVGGRIVAEVLLGLIQGDRNSYLNLPPAPALRVPLRIRDLGDLTALSRAEALTVSLPAGPPIVPIANITAPLLRPNFANLLASFRRWRPTLPAATAGTFTMVDLIAFANR